MPWTQVATLNELPDGCLLEVIHNGLPYAVCNTGGAIHALLGVCPHQGGPLGQGALDGSLVTCPWHAFQFDPATGVCDFNDELRVPTFSVRVEGNEILVDLPGRA